MEAIGTALERLRSRAAKISSKQIETRSIRGTYDLSPEALERERYLIQRVEAEQERCKGCKGICTRPEGAKGFVPVLQIKNDNAIEAVVMCKHEKQRRNQAKLDRLFRSSRIPRAYSTDTFSDYDITDDNKEAVEAAKWIIEQDDGRGLFIFGPRGTGKTKLASIIANERMKKGRQVLFSSVPDLMGDIRATFHKGNTEEALASIKAAEFLVLDDLGAERMTEWVAEQLFSIINHRYNESLATVITSNYSPQDIIGRMATVDQERDTIDYVQGKRIMSRIYEMCDRIYLGGTDHRTRKVTA